jgi:hypothetical protein
VFFHEISGVSPLETSSGKGSPVVNLSEDIFAGAVPPIAVAVGEIFGILRRGGFSAFATTGYNVHMREEASPHVDALEFEKGREAGETQRFLRGEQTESHGLSMFTTGFAMRKVVINWGKPISRQNHNSIS